MTWELCQKLKEAGFPQMGLGFVIMKESPLPNETYTRMSWEMYTQRVYTSEFVYEPTLKELIDACGDRFYALHDYGNSNLGATIPVPLNPKKRFEAWYIPAKYDGKGATPEEAVANLWLSLKKK